MEHELKILHKLGIKNPTKDQLLALSTELKKFELEASIEALKEERSRCYEYTLHCRNSWMKIKEEIPQDIVIAAETIMEGIQKGCHVTV